MQLAFRETRVDDIEGMFTVRARTRQNPMSKDQLASYGITSETNAANLANGRIKGWVCFHDSTLVGFCNGNTATGEVLVIAVLPEYEGKGVGTRLLSFAVEWLCSSGFKKLWLAASPDPGIRAHGFYRSLGWRASGKTLENGDQILEWEPNNGV